MCVLRTSVAVFAVALSSQIALAAGTSAVLRGAESVFKAGAYKRVARLAALGVDDLAHASRVDNLHGLLELAETEGRIDPIQMLRYAKLYAKQEDGDRLLLTCLQVRRCEPERFLDITRMSPLHAEVVKRSPALEPTQVGHVVGAISENLMLRFFSSSGWEALPGQIGRQGIDGLFVKRVKGRIRDVLIVESKYNTSSLQSTNHGVQMSEDWIRRKLLELTRNDPANPDYATIAKLVDGKAYRAILWTLKVEDDALKISIQKVHGKGGDIELVALDSAGEESQHLARLSAIKLSQPSDSFEKELVRWYQDELARVRNAPN